ncbi:hypothetical protein GCK72_007499 [Caenorhabditis remanei]|uniref:BTB domain-containing protein n=1 Tax=Caenorhabditis remanei TaxID=31234 RepID=A0A6A5HHG7_CAERE|nr:hypothetical protein GCK72_007499 [Caenorhabditis remanei]KAF1767540.1 hypothetical protein GCK72_007499 [Caenorhabditis remanei]
MSEEKDNVKPGNNDEGSSSAKRRKIDGSEEKITNNPSESVIEKVLEMCQEVLNKQKDLEMSNLEIVEKLRSAEDEIKKLSKEQQEKFDSIQSDLNEINQTLKPEEPSKMEENDDSADITAFVNLTQKSKEMMSTSGKYFVLKHKFKNISSIKSGKIHISEKEEHFGVPWQLYMKRSDGYLSFFFSCLLFNNIENTWEIEVEYELKIVSPSSREKKQKFCSVFKSQCLGSLTGVCNFIEWDELEKDLVVDDCFYAEIGVKIKKMSGIYKEDLKSFDKTMEDVSDVVLIVNEERFFVSKLYLASHSLYFKALFLGKFNEAKKTEIELSGIDADDFQNYLEVLYGEQSIDKFTVEGILLVADMYDTPMVIRKCEDFLVKKSLKTLKKKLEMSVRYNLEGLKKKCLGEIKSIDDIKSVIPGNTHDMDSSIMAELLEKSLEFH